MDVKSLRIRFDKIDGFLRVYDGTRYLVLFGAEKYDSIYNIRYLIEVKSGVYIFSKRCKDQSWFIWFLTSRKKTPTFHNVIILIKLVFNKNNYYYNIFLEKCSYK